MAHYNRVIAVFSARGGTGATTIAGAVATRLASGTTGAAQVALLDFHLPFGNAAATMGLAPAVTLGAPAHPDAGPAVQRLFTPTAVGVDVVASPLDPLIAEGVSAPECAAVLAHAQTAYRATVVDVGAVLMAASLTAIDAADVVLVVTTGDRHGVSSAAAALHTLEVLGVPPQHLLVVANRLGSPHHLGASELRAALGIAPLWGIPETADLALAARRGRLLMRDWPDHPWSMSVARLADAASAALPEGPWLAPAPSRRLRWRTRAGAPPNGAPPAPIGVPTTLIGRSAIG